MNEQSLHRKVEALLLFHIWILYDKLEFLTYLDNGNVKFDKSPDKRKESFTNYN